MKDKLYKEFYESKCKCKTWDYFKKNHGNCPGVFEKELAELQEKQLKVTKKK